MQESIYLIMKTDGYYNSPHKFVYNQDEVENIIKVLNKDLDYGDDYYYWIKVSKYINDEGNKKK